MLRSGVAGPVVRLTVTGSRDWTDWEVLAAHLDRSGPTLLSHGLCRGADMLSDEWALQRGVGARVYPAEWYPLGRFDRAAGHKRNRWMFEDFGPELVVAFKDGFDFTLSAGGTEHMVKTALTGGVPVQVVSTDGVVEELFPLGRLPFS